MAEKLTKLTEDEHIVMLAFGHLDERMWGIEADDAGRAIQLGYARGILAALEAAGRLLPSGGEVSTQWGVRWHAVPNQDEWDDWGFSDEEHAREEMASSPTPSTLLRLRSITLPVEPVVSDNEEGTDG